MNDPYVSNRNKKIVLISLILTLKGKSQHKETSL